MTEELKPCPFCGGKAQLVDEDTGDMKTYYVLCDRCVQTYPFSQKERAIEYWNRRQEMIATWEPTDEEYQWKCSNCYETFDYDYPSSIYSSLLYCPNCGARMRKQKQEDNE